MQRVFRCNGFGKDIYRCCRFVVVLCGCFCLFDFVVVVVVVVFVVVVVVVVVVCYCFCFCCLFTCCSCFLFLFISILANLEVNGKAATRKEDKSINGITISGKLFCR